MITPALPVQSENPLVKPPSGKLKKNAKKIVGGLLALSLLMGGGLLGFQELGRRQTVEQKATPGDPPPGCNITPASNMAVTNISATAATLNWTPGSGGNYVKLWVSTSNDPTGNCNHLVNKTTDSACVVNENGVPGTNQADITAIPSTYQVSNLQPNTTYYWRLMMWKESGCDSGPGPIAFTTTSLNASPSPSLSQSCLDLTKNTAAPKLNDSITFTCKGEFSSNSNPVAFFRTRVAPDNWVVSPAQTINAANNKADFEVLIDKTGDWETECRVCSDESGCTTWGQAQ